MSDQTILLILTNTQLRELLERDTLRPAGYKVTSMMGRNPVNINLNNSRPDLIILEEGLGNGDILKYATDLVERHPAIPVIFVPQSDSNISPVQVLRSGVVDCLYPPIGSDDVLQAIKRGIHHRKKLEDWVRKEARRDTDKLHRRVTVLETLERIGRSVTASLDLNDVIAAVVEGAVKIVQGEEGCLLLLDEESGDLYIRATMKSGGEAARTCHTSVDDSLAAEIIRTGKPVRINDKQTQENKATYLVQSLIYVPLKVHERVIGVLGVINHQNEGRFSEHHLKLVSALADYAAIAIENARLYRSTEIEKNKLETILTRIEDGVVVVGQDQRILLINRTARDIFALGKNPVVSQMAVDVFDHPELLSLLTIEDIKTPYRSEIALDDGRIFNAQLTTIKGVGLAVTMQDITHLKELDRIKNDFVSTVSHDLRSPLTAILGYIDLIERAGSINERQREYIHRVRFSVRGITDLISDLLDLGRIESGFDAHKTIVPVSTILHYSVDNIRTQLEKKNQKLELDILHNLPNLLGDETRLRQMIDNLLSNASKYSPVGGVIYVSARHERDQIIIQVSDNGYGIPLSDQPYIFDKFFRAANVDEDILGTGLGLAIVKSIVENHQGRIWVESALGEGTKFTVVLPTMTEKLNDDVVSREDSQMSRL